MWTSSVNDAFSPVLSSRSHPVPEHLLTAFQEAWVEASPAPAESWRGRDCAWPSRIVQTGVRVPGGILRRTYGRHRRAPGYDVLRDAGPSQRRCATTAIVAGGRRVYSNAEYVLVAFSAALSIPGRRTYACKGVVHASVVCPLWRHRVEGSPARHQLVAGLRPRVGPAPFASDFITVRIVVPTPSRGLRNVNLGPARLASCGGLRWSGLPALPHCLLGRWALDSQPSKRQINNKKEERAATYAEYKTSKRACHSR